MATENEPDNQERLAEAWRLITKVAAQEPSRYGIHLLIAERSQLNCLPALALLGWWVIYSIDEADATGRLSTQPHKLSALYKPAGQLEVVNIQEAAETFDVALHNLLSRVIEEMTDGRVADYLQRQADIFWATHIDAQGVFSPHGVSSPQAVSSVQEEAE